MACSSIHLLILFGLKGYFQFEMIMNKGTINIPVLDLAFTSMGSTDAPKLNKISDFGPYLQTASLKRQLILKCQFLVIPSTERLSETCSSVLGQPLAPAEESLSVSTVPGAGDPGTETPSCRRHAQRGKSSSWAQQELEGWGGHAFCRDSAVSQKTSWNRKEGDFARQDRKAQGHKLV